MNINEQTRFTLLYKQYLNELTLQGKQPKTIEMYSRALRKVGDYFDCCPDHLTQDQLKIYIRLAEDGIDLHFLQLVELRFFLF